MPAHAGTPLTVRQPGSSTLQPETLVARHWADAAPPRPYGRVAHNYAHNDATAVWPTATPYELVTQNNQRLSRPSNPHPAPLNGVSCVDPCICPSTPPGHACVLLIGMHVRLPQPRRQSAEEVRTWASWIFRHTTALARNIACMTSKIAIVGWLPPPSTQHTPSIGCACICAYSAP